MTRQHWSPFRSALKPATALAALLALATAPEAAERLSDEPSLAPPGGACGQVVVAEFGWATAGLASRLLEIALTDGYGCEVVRMPADPGRAVAAVAEAHRAMSKAEAEAAPLDAAPISPPAAVVAVGAVIDQAAGRESDGVALGAELYGGLDRSGWFAPRWLTAAHPQIQRIEDAARNPQIFSENPKQRPKLHICPVSWPCHADDKSLVEQLNLSEHFEIVTPASGDELTASLIEAWRNRRPWLGSYWSPSAALAEHAMTRLQSGSLEICEPNAAKSCRPPHKSAPRLTLYPEALETRAPHVAAMLRRFAMAPEVVLEALAWRASNNADLDDAALQLLDSRPQLWRSWLDAPGRSRFEERLSERLRQADERAASAQQAAQETRRAARQGLNGASPRSQREQARSEGAAPPKG